MEFETYSELCSLTKVVALSHGDVVGVLFPDNIAHLVIGLEGTKLKIKTQLVKIVRFLVWAQFPKTSFKINPSRSHPHTLNIGGNQNFVIMTFEIGSGPFFMDWKLKFSCEQSVGIISKKT